MKFWLKMPNTIGSPLSELTRLLVSFDHVARLIVKRGSQREALERSESLSHCKRQRGKVKRSFLWMTSFSVILFLPFLSSF
jgi:hypothetical protein